MINCFLENSVKQLGGFLLQQIVAENILNKFFTKGKFQQLGITLLDINKGSNGEDLLSLFPHKL